MLVQCVLLLRVFPVWVYALFSLPVSDDISKLNGPQWVKWQNGFFPTSIPLRVCYLQPGPHSCRITTFIKCPHHLWEQSQDEVADGHHHSFPFGLSVYCTFVEIPSLQVLSSPEMPPAFPSLQWEYCVIKKENPLTSKC